MISKKYFFGRKDIRHCAEPEKIENYELAIKDSKMWVCHHRLETHFSDGTERPKNAQLSKEELIALGMYHNRPAEELIFLSYSDHQKIHKFKRGGWEHMKGKEPWNKGKKMSEEFCKKISESHKGKPSLNKGKPGKCKGKHWKLVDNIRVWY